MDIGIDVDEPIYPWLDAQHALCTKVLGLPPMPTPASWHPYKSYQRDGKTITLEEWYEILAQGALDGSLYDWDINPGVVEQFGRLKAAEHRIHLVTARGAFVHGHLIRAHTHAMIERFKIPHDAITFTLEKDMVKTDWFLDDHPKYIDAVAKTGTEGVLLNHPHNRGAEGYLRVDSLKEFVDMVLGEE